VAIDGKSINGGATAGHARPHLLAAVAHDGSIVLVQHQVPDKGSKINESPRWWPGWICPPWWSPSMPLHTSGPPLSTSSPSKAPAKP
jgi:hypothetical protein